MNDSKKTEKNDSKNESKKTESKNDKFVIIGTNELSEILSEKIGRNIEPKYIRTKFRNDIRFNEYDDNERTIYRFKNPSNGLNSIIERFIEIESERNERKKLSAERKSKKRKTNNSYYDYDDNGNLIKKTVTNETK